MISQAPMSLDEIKKQANDGIVTCLVYVPLYKVIEDTRDNFFQLLSQEVTDGLGGIQVIDYQLKPHSSSYSTLCFKVIADASVLIEKSEAV